MIFYSDQNVYEAAKSRIRQIFENHSGSRISVSFSGGKDSTTVLFLVKEVMDEMGISKIPVFWCDQEIEAPMVVDYTRKIMNLPWVEPLWVQSAYPKYNAHIGEWDMAWKPGVEWVRDKEPEGTFTDIDLSDYDHYQSEYNFFLHNLLGKDYVTIGGLHIDESPTRRLCLLRDVSICPGAKDVEGHIYYPLFDWSVNDIWYYIFSNRIEYCPLYNYLFSQQPLKACRVGSYWHEQSHVSIPIIKKIDPQFYDRMQRRLKGINATVNSYEMLSQFVKSLPPYFSSWPEYFDYLINHITPEDNREEMSKVYYSMRKRFLGMSSDYPELQEQIEERLGLAAVSCILKEDRTMRKMMNSETGLLSFVKRYEERTRKNAP